MSERNKVAQLSAFAVALVASLMLAVPTTTPASPLPARIQTIDSDFTYMGVTGNFSVSATPVYYGDSTGYITTDWGAAGVHTGIWTLIGIKWGASTVNGTWYDAKMNYWYYNATGVNARPFASDWSHWYLVQNDSFAHVFERYAQAPSAYSGSDDEWNVTVRIAILHEDPVIICDAWLRFCNSTSLIDHFDLNPVYYEPAAWTGITHDRDTAHSMGYMVQDAGGWAVGVIGATPDTTPNAATPADKHMVNRTQTNLSEETHVRTVMVVGQNLTGIQAVAEDVGSMWATNENRTDRHLVIAKNGDTFDSLSYFPDSGYTVYPSGTSETIIEDGAETTLSLGVNRIMDYQKVPVIVFVDDHQYARGENAAWDWLFGAAERFDTSVTLPSYFGGTIHADDFLSYVTLSSEHNGTLFEIADHSNNHTSYYTFQDYARPFNDWTDSETDWAVYSDTPLLSEGLANNAWSYQTFDALGAAGCKNIRLSQSAAGWMGPKDYNLTGSPVWVAPFQYIVPYATPGAALATFGHMNGYLAFEGHVTDIDNASERADYEACWSWVQNETDLQSMTFAAWSDLWHHRLVYSELDGRAVIDLTTAQTNHYTRISPNAAGEAPLLWDMTTDSAARTVSGNSSSVTVVLTAGHVYQEVASVEITGSATYGLTAFDIDGATLAEMTVSAASGSAVEFAFDGLNPSDTYKVYVDDVVMATIPATGGHVSFAYSSFSTHTFKVILPETFEEEEEETQVTIPSERSPASTAAGTTSLSWTSPTMLAFICLSIIIVAALLTRRPHGNSRRRYR